MTWLHYLLASAIVIVCMLLVVIILLQKGRGGGLSGAFGGGGGSGSAFGAKTGDVFTWITVAFVCLYFLLNIAGNFQFRQAVTPVPLGIGAPETEAGADGTPGVDGSDAPLIGDVLPPVQPADGVAAPVVIQPPIINADLDAATPTEEGDSDDAEEPDAAAEEPADPPAEEKSDNPAGGQQPQPNPDSP